jgi:hypothetical protein
VRCLLPRLSLTAIGHRHLRRRNRRLQVGHDDRPPTPTKPRPGGPDARGTHRRTQPESQLAGGAFLCCAVSYAVSVLYAERGARAGGGGEGGGGRREGAEAQWQIGTDTWTNETDRQTVSGKADTHAQREAAEQSVGLHRGRERVSLSLLLLPLLLLPLPC